MSQFSLAASRFFLSFSKLTMMYLDVDLFAIILLEIQWASWDYKLMFYNTLKKSLPTISANILSVPFSFPFGIPNINMLVNLILFHRFQRLWLFFFNGLLSVLQIGLFLLIVPQGFVFCFFFLPPKICSWTQLVYFSSQLLCFSRISISFFFNSF